MNDEQQWENEGGQVKPEPVDDKEQGGESCSKDCGVCDICHPPAYFELP